MATIGCMETQETGLRTALSVHCPQNALFVVPSIFAFKIERPKPGVWRR
ncbi:MAG: hypothetical protein LBG72_08385 [Spirochaetaceae bacterium]|nr:hypothetical protein [Spirochaetaceae bacterium]